MRIWIEVIWLGCPAFADASVAHVAAKRLQSATVIVSVEGVVEVYGQLGVAVLMVSLYRRVPNRPVHPLDLAVDPGMFDLGQPMGGIMFIADSVEDMVKGVFVVRHVDELEAGTAQRRAPVSGCLLRLARSGGR